jgi:ATP-grasp domain
MDIHEYHAKELLSGYGVPIQPGAVAYSPDQASFVASELGGWHWAVMAQIHSGARGKAGGVKLCKTYHEVRDAAKGMLGRKLVTQQTGPEGKIVQRVYVEVAEKFERELYLGIVLDRKAERVRIIASSQGGMEIEDIAKTSPQAILQVIVEPAVGLQAFQSRELAFGLGLNIKQVSRAVAAIVGAYRAFRDLDAGAPCPWTAGSSTSPASGWRRRSSPRRNPSRRARRNDSVGRGDFIRPQFFREGVQLCAPAARKQPVVLLFDHRITLTAAFLQPHSIEHGDVTADITYQPDLL